MILGDIQDPPGGWQAKLQDPNLRTCIHSNIIKIQENMTHTSSTQSRDLLALSLVSRCQRPISLEETAVLESGPYGIIL